MHFRAVETDALYCIHLKVEIQFFPSVSSLEMQDNEKPLNVYYFFCIPLLMIMINSLRALVLCKLHQCQMELDPPRPQQGELSKATPLIL